jgi:hypothetical protein
MSKFSLNPDMNIEVTVRFIAKGNDGPLTGDEYTLRLYDKDIIGADFLGESGLDANGMARIKFSHSSFGEWDSLEQYPDFYFILFRGGSEIFRSKVMENTDVDFLEQFKMGEGELVDLGTYLIGD